MATRNFSLCRVEKLHFLSLEATLWFPQEYLAEYADLFKYKTEKFCIKHRNLLLVGEYRLHKSRVAILENKFRRSINFNTSFLYSPASYASKQFFLLFFLHTFSSFPSYNTVPNYFSIHSRFVDKTNCRKLLKLIYFGTRLEKYSNAPLEIYLKIIRPSSFLRTINYHFSVPFCASYFYSRNTAVRQNLFSFVVRIYLSSLLKDELLLRYIL